MKSTRSTLYTVKLGNKIFVLSISIEMETETFLFKGIHVMSTSAS